MGFKLNGPIQFNQPIYCLCATTQCRTQLTKSEYKSKLAKLQGWPPNTYKEVNYLWLWLLQSAGIIFLPRTEYNSTNYLNHWFYHGPRSKCMANYSIFNSLFLGCSMFVCIFWGMVVGACTDQNIGR